MKPGFISASDINKFTYCPYQWYYYKLHGSKKIRELYHLRNIKCGYDDAAYANLKKGLSFHSRYRLRYLLKKLVILLIFILVLLTLIYIGMPRWK